MYVSLKWGGTRQVYLPQKSRTMIGRIQTEPEPSRLRDGSPLGHDTRPTARNLVPIVSTSQGWRVESKHMVLFYQCWDLSSGPEDPKPTTSIVKPPPSILSFIDFFSNLLLHESRVHSFPFVHLNAALCLANIQELFKTWDSSLMVNIPQTTLHFLRVMSIICRQSVNAAKAVSRKGWRWMVLPLPSQQ